MKPYHAPHLTTTQVLDQLRKPGWHAIIWCAQDRQRVCAVKTAQTDWALDEAATDLLCQPWPPIIVSLTPDGKARRPEGPTGVDCTDERYSSEYYWETANPPPPKP
jgi:hypothetical protein